MTTSGTSAFSVSRDDIIRDALLDVGAIDETELATPEQVSDGSRKLNMLIKTAQATGMGLWLNQLFTIVLTAGAQSYQRGPAAGVDRPLEILEARYRTAGTNGTDTPLTAMSRLEYMALPLKSSTGPTTQYYYDPQTVNGVLYVWPVSTDLTAVIVGTAKVPVQSFVNLNDTPDFPQEWYLPLYSGLAVLLSPSYDVPADKFKRLQDLAAQWWNMADGYDREKASVYFTPSFR